MPPKKSKKKLYLILLGIVITTLIIWKLATSKGQEYTEFTTRNSDIIQSIDLSGHVDAKLREDLHFPAGGLVTYFPWTEGDEIKKFSTIASLDTRSLKKTLQQKLNLYATSRHTFDGTQDTYEKERDDGDVDKELRRILESSQYTLDNTVIDVELQDLALKLSRLYAPFTGILTSSPITSPHVNVSALDTFTLIDPSTLYFLADLDESDLDVVVPGLSVDLELDAFPDLIIAATVERVSYASKVTSTGTTYEVMITIPESELAKLRLGLNGTASVILSEKRDILTLPIEAVIEDENRNYVLAMDGSKTIEKDVQTGISDNSRVEITDGLSLGDVVVLEK